MQGKAQHWFHHEASCSLPSGDTCIVYGDGETGGYICNGKIGLGCCLYFLNANMFVLLPFRSRQPSVEMNLMATRHPGMFTPMECNSTLDTANCVDFLSLSFDLSSVVEIPCGECVTMDLTGALEFEGGLNLAGKLKFRASREDN
jgi:hypothetical protein